MIPTCGPAPCLCRRSCGRGKGSLWLLAAMAGIVVATAFTTDARDVSFQPSPIAKGRAL